MKRVAPLALGASALAFSTPAMAVDVLDFEGIGNNNPVELLHVVAELEKCLGKKAKRELLPMQPGDVPETYADVDDLMRDVGFRPSTPVETGIRNFVDWYRAYTGA